MFAEGIEDRLHEAPQKFRQLDGVKFHPNPSLSAFRQKSQHRKHKLFAQAAMQPLPACSRPPSCCFLRSMNKPLSPAPLLYIYSQHPKYVPMNCPTGEYVCHAFSQKKGPAGFHPRNPMYVYQLIIIPDVLSAFHSISGLHRSPSNRLCRFRG